MTKRELLMFLEPFSDEIEIYIQDTLNPKRAIAPVYEWPKPISKNSARIVLVARGAE